MVPAKFLLPAAPDQPERSGFLKTIGSKMTNDSVQRENMKISAICNVISCVKVRSEDLQHVVCTLSYFLFAEQTDRNVSVRIEK